MLEHNRVALLKLVCGSEGQVQSLAAGVSPKPLCPEPDVKPVTQLPFGSPLYVLFLLLLATSFHPTLLHTAILGVITGGRALQERRLLHTVLLRDPVEGHMCASFCYSLHGRAKLEEQLVVEGVAHRAHHSAVGIPQSIQISHTCDGWWICGRVVLPYQSYSQLVNTRNTLGTLPQRRGLGRASILAEHLILEMDSARWRAPGGAQLSVAYIMKC